MASFQDNSGDIILDAVLTDVGRQRLARGDGSFNVFRFALGDDEINHGLYDTTASASAKDLKILQSPIFEAFTNAATALKYKLISNPNPDLLYLPVARVNTQPKQAGGKGGFPYAASALNASTTNQYVVLANQTAVDQYIGESVSNTEKGIPDGFIVGTSAKEAASYPIVVDQGLDSPAISNQQVDKLTSDLIETTYIVQMDNRLLKLGTLDGKPYKESFVDTDNIATYVVPKIKNGKITGFYSDGANTEKESGLSPIQGPRGDTIRLPLHAALDATVDTTLYTRIGTVKSGYHTKVTPNKDASAIDTVVRLTGFDTGITVDIPVRVIRTSN